MASVSCKAVESHRGPGPEIPLWECPCWECWRLEMACIRDSTPEGEKPDTQTYQTWRDERL